MSFNCSDRKVWRSLIKKLRVGRLLKIGLLDDRTRKADVPSFVWQPLDFSSCFFLYFSFQLIFRLLSWLIYLLLLFSIQWLNAIDCRDVSYYLVQTCTDKISYKEYPYSWLHFIETKPPISSTPRMSLQWCLIRHARAASSLFLTIIINENYMQNSRPITLKLI